MPLAIGFCVAVVPAPGVAFGTLQSALTTGAMRVPVRAGLIVAIRLSLSAPAAI